MIFARLDRYSQLYVHQRLIRLLRRTLRDRPQKGTILGLLRHVEEFDLDSFWDRQLHCRERLKRALFVLADGALDGAFELALHQVDDDGLISLQVELPVGVSLLLVSAHQFWHFHILLLSHPVDILMELIEELGEEFGGIVLFVPHEHHVVLTEDFLEVARVHVAIAARFVPHVVIQASQVRDDLAFGAQRVLLVDFLGKSHGQQVLSEAVNVG